MDLTDPKQLPRFWQVFESNWERLRPFRDSRRRLIQAYAGSEYPGNAEYIRKRRTLVATIFTTADVYAGTLAANRPRVSISSQNRSLTPFCRRYAKAVNNTVAEMQLDETLQELVLDSLFGIGIAKVFFAAGNPVEMPNPMMPPEPSMFDPPEAMQAYIEAQNAIEPSILIDPGRPFVERVSLDDFCFDMGAPRWDLISFAAHSYRVTLESVRNDDRFDPEVVKKLSAESKWQGRGPNSEERASDLSNNRDVDELDDMVTVMDVWLPRTKTWAVLSAKNPGLPPLFVEKWRGPEDGPFIPLRFTTIPDNIMPISILANIEPLHELANQLMRKTARQARNQKTNLLYSGGHEDAKALVEAEDLQSIKVRDPDKIKERRTGGPDNQVMGTTQVVKAQANEDAGNVNALGGIKASTGTVGQDQMLTQAASGRISKMQSRYVDFTAKIMKHIAWMLWVDETKRMPGQEMIPGLSMPVDVSWTPEDREGDFLDYNFSVDPYSTVYRSPEQQIAAINDRVQNLYLPAMPFLQQQGMSIDFQAINEAYAELLDIPLFKNIIVSADPPPEDPPSGRPPQPNMPTNTTRTYERRDAANPVPPEQQALQSMQGSSASQDTGID